MVLTDIIRKYLVGKKIKVYHITTTQISDGQVFHHYVKDAMTFHNDPRFKKVQEEMIVEITNFTTLDDSYEGDSHAIHFNVDGVGEGHIGIWTLTDDIDILD